MLKAADLKTRATELGFDLCGIAAAADYPELAFLRDWIDRGYAGDMRYLARTAERRADVRQVLPSARSVIVLGTIYNVDRPYSTQLTEDGVARLARYAWGDDYHEVIGERLERLLEWMRERAGEPVDARAYVDTGPVQERVCAHYAGLGWIGKNTCLINPELGSWLFLAEILCSLALEPDSPGLDRCGTCTLCLDACPTGALIGAGVLDARKCLSYLTIELKTAIPGELREPIGAHVYGCDICQEVCPWNLAPARSGAAEWMPRAALDRPSLVALWRRSDDELRRILKGSAMKRTGLKGLRRNLAVAMANSAAPAAAAALGEEDQVEKAPSIADPIVAEHVDWAKRKLRG